MMGKSLRLLRVSFYFSFHFLLHQLSPEPNFTIPMLWTPAQWRVEEGRLASLSCWHHPGPSSTPVPAHRGPPTTTGDTCSVERAIHNSWKAACRQFLTSNTSHCSPWPACRGRPSCRQTIRGRRQARPRQSHLCHALWLRRVTVMPVYARVHSHREMEGEGKVRGDMRRRGGL